MTRVRIAALLLPLAVACAPRGPSIAADAAVTLAVQQAGNPTVATDAVRGVCYAAWVETRDGSSDVYLARDPGGVAGNVVRVNDVPGDAAAHDQAPPQVAVGPEGNVYVVWQNNIPVEGRRFPASNLRFARSTDGGLSFEPAIHVNDDADGPPASHTFHDIAVAGDGTIHISWIDGRERARAELARVEQARAAAAATALGADLAHAVHGADVAHGGNVAHGGDAAHGSHSMHGVTMPGSEVRVARSVDGGRSFGESIVVARDVCPCCRTAVVAAADGRVFVAYRVSTNNIRNIAVVRSTDGGATFAAPVTVHDDGWEIDGCPHSGASLALDGYGRLHVAWYTGAEQRQGLWHAMSADDGASFGPPQAVQAGGWVPVSQVKLATAADGAVWAVWDDRREAESVVHLARVGDRGLRTVWSGPGEHPALAVAGHVMVAWRTHEQSAHVVQLRGRSAGIGP